MDEKWKLILQEVVMLIDKYQNLNINTSSVVSHHVNVINKYYGELVAKDRINEFWKFLYNDFKNEPDLFTLLASVIYECTYDEKCLQEVMKLLLFEDIDLYRSIWFRQQIEFSIFTNSKIGLNYDTRRKIHSKQLIKLENLLDLGHSYIPYKYRNENRIVIVTNQLLSDNHAPTRNVKEICSALQNLGKEVILIVAVENPIFMQTWYNSRAMNYIEEYTGDFVINYYGQDISGSQTLFENLENLKCIINKIYDFNPQFIWYMGGTSLFADLFRKATSVVSMPFSDGYTVSDSPILLEYMNSGSEAIKLMEKYINNEQQLKIHFNFEQPIHPSYKKIYRKDFGLSDNQFLVAIVGNRLDEEITDEFIQVINNVIRISNDVHIVFIGDMKEINNKIDENKVSYLGYQSDLISVLSLVDVFLNPPRKGGGTGAYWSLYNSVPVVTLGNCDVANCVCSDFICENEKDMVCLIDSYINNTEFYLEMRNKAKSIIDEIEKNNDLQMNIQNLIQNIKDIILEKEI